MNLRYAILAEIEDFVVFGDSEGRVAITNREFAADMPKPVLDVGFVTSDRVLRRLDERTKTIIEVPIDKVAFFLLGEYRYLRVNYGFNPELQTYAVVSEPDILEDRARMWLEGQI